MPEVLLDSKKKGKKASVIFTGYVVSYLKSKGYIVLRKRPYGGVAVIRLDRRPLLLCVSLNGRMISSVWKTIYKLDAVDIGVAYPRFETLESDGEKYVVLHLDEPRFKAGLSPTSLYSERLKKYAYVPEDFEARKIEKAGKKIPQRSEQKAKEEHPEKEEKQEDLSEWRIFERS
jgi:hypothetical protein